MHSIRRSLAHVAAFGTMLTACCELPMLPLAAPTPSSTSLSGSRSCATSLAASPKKLYTSPARSTSAASAHRLDAASARAPRTGVPVSAPADGRHWQIRARFTCGDMQSTDSFCMALVVYATFACLAESWRRPLTGAQLQRVHNTGSIRGPQNDALAATSSRRTRREPHQQSLLRIGGTQFDNPETLGSGKD